jgi:RNA polymerase subunit RPABC4/transcription elongation factor Spt4
MMGYTWKCPLCGSMVTSKDWDTYNDLIRTHKCGA